MPISQSEHELICLLWRQFMSGDQRALGDLAEILYPSLFHYGTKFSSNQSLIEDSIQDLFLRLWEKRSGFKQVNSPKSYLFASIRNNLIYKLKTEPVFQELPENEKMKMHQLIVDKSEEEHAEWLSATMDKSLMMLPARQREALYLRYYENLSYEEIAVVMGLQRQVVANYLHEGINRLRQYWQKIILMLLGYIFL